MNPRKPLCLALASASLLAGCSDDPFSTQSRAPHELQPALSTGAYTPGATYYGKNQYVEYIAGNLPVIFTAPHGGSLQPADIPTRTAEACGGSATTVRDTNTQELVRAIRDAFFARTGKYPHIVINRLHRDRLDANRDLTEAACGNEAAATAWSEYHDFIEAAKSRIVADHGKGWYTDVHGHGHTVQRLELGYELSASRLRLSDATLDGSSVYEDASTFRTFSQQSPLSFSALLRGPTSLGTLFGNAGYPSVPSQQDPAPASGEPYFSGGYNTERHGCKGGGQICGVQIEAHMTGVRDNAANRAAFAAKLAEVYDEYLSVNFGIDLPVAAPPAAGTAIVVDNDGANNDPALARFAASANWSASTNNTQKYLGDFRFATAGSSFTNDGAEFFFWIGTPGTYSVDAWWPAATGRSTGVSYRVFELDGGTMLADLKRSQQTDGGRWNALGTYTFGRVGWAKVLVSRSLSTTPGNIAADAIRVTLVSAANRAPVARFSAPAGADEGEALSFDGSRSYDQDGDALTYAWSFGDGTTATGAQPTYAYPDDGTFTVTLTVTDVHGAASSTSRTVTIANVAPQVSAFAGATLLQGETYTSSGSFTDPGADTWSARVDYGDGSGPRPLALSGKSFGLSHTYAQAGTFTVTVEVGDGTGIGTRTAEVTVQSPVQGITALSASVDALVAEGKLSQGNGTALGATLQGAAQQLERGSRTAAVSQMNAFVQQVEALVRSGDRLSAADGARLTAFAQRIVRSIRGR